MGKPRQLRCFESNDCSRFRINVYPTSVDYGYNEDADIQNTATSNRQLHAVNHYTSTTNIRSDQYDSSNSLRRPTMFHVRLIVFVFLAAGALLFLVAIIRALKLSKDKKPELMERFYQQVIRIIGGVLATNLGGVLGISVEQAQTPGPEASFMLLLRNLDAPSTIQVIAMYLYVVSLFIVAISWCRMGPKEDPAEVVPEVPQLTYTAIGIAGGLMAVALN